MWPIGQKTLDHPLSHLGGASDPIQYLGASQAEDLVAFMLGVDERLRTARFHRHMSPDVVRAHYRGIRWDDAVVAAWVAGGIIHGVCEGYLLQGTEGLQAEVALCIEADLRGRRVGPALVARVVSALASRGARRIVMVLHRDDCAHADTVRRLGGVVDWEGGMAILHLGDPKAGANWPHPNG